MDGLAGWKHALGRIAPLPGQRNRLVKGLLSFTRLRWTVEAAVAAIGAYHERNKMQLFAAADVII
jgi:hypothetical protein